MEIKIPQVGESITEVVIASWLKEDGDLVEKDEILCEIDSDKATFEIPAETNGRLKILKKEGETVAVGEVIARIEPSDGKMVEPRREEKPVAAKPAASSAATVREEKSLSGTHPPLETREQSKVSPVAARILAEANIDPKTVRGSGPGGKIAKEDALRAVQQHQQQASTAAPEVVTAEKPSEAPRPKTAVPTGEARSTRRVKMSTLRKTIARRLVEAKNQTAMLTTFNEIDMSQVMEIRRRYKETFKEKHEVGLGFMSFFIRAACIALQEFPEVNAMIEGDDLVYHDYCDIGIAVSTTRGLVVPVIRNADKLSMAEIENEVLRLATRARESKLALEEMTGGTFTITNGGVFGSLMSTPIINYPQAAILGMHKIMERPVVVEGQIVVRPMMYVALSYDHRIIDGRESVSFLVRIKELIEDPTRMLLEV